MDDETRFDFTKEFEIFMDDVFLYVHERGKFVEGDLKIIFDPQSEYITFLHTAKNGTGTEKIIYLKSK